MLFRSELCKEVVKITEAIRNTIEKNLSQIPENQKKDLDLSGGIKIYKGKGCPKCGGTGMKGRVGIFEVFYIDDEIINLLGGKVEEEVLRKTVKNQGMITMKQDGILKVLKGITTLEEIERATEEESLEID